MARNASRARLQPTQRSVVTRATTIGSSLTIISPSRYARLAHIERPFPGASHSSIDAVAVAVASKLLPRSLLCQECAVAALDAHAAG
eukprot:5965862-Prymnesium_polylepis.1